MRRILPLALVAFLIPLLNAQEKPAPVRVCVATLQNSSRHIVNPGWERDQLVRALERTNKSKDVKKGKAPKIETVALDSSGEPDTTVEEKNCGFVLYTDLTEVLQAGRPAISVPPPGAVGVSGNAGDPRAYPPDLRSATVNYRLMRAGDPEAWDSGLVSAEDRLTEDVLVSQLMDQVANRVASAVRKPHNRTPE